MRILVIGGYGTFGHRLIRLLAHDAGITFIVGGRSLEKARAFAASVETQAKLEPALFDREGDLDAQLRALKPDLVVDASGPFQRYGSNPYRVVNACIDAGINYIDLADGAAFVEGIDACDRAAREHGVFALSGVSTLPALSMAAVRELTRGWRSVDSIAIGIAPSPYFALGKSVVTAIAGYAGQKLKLTRGGRTATAYTLTEARRVTVAPPAAVPLRNRRFTLVDVPDLRVAAMEYPTLQDVWAGAGTKPSWIGSALSALSWLVRLRLLPSLSALAPLFHWVSAHLRYGEDRGGMFVTVRGTDANGTPIERQWHLTAEGTEGPFIPAMAAAATIARIRAGSSPEPGARTAAHELSLADFAPLFASRRIVTGTRTVMPPDAPLYRRALSDAWDDLPAPIRAMHDRVRRARGRATVERGRSLLARIGAAVMRFPKSGTDIPVEVTFTERQGREIWQRNFARRKFTSVQWLGRGKSEHLLCERFGPFTFDLALVCADDKLRLVPRRWRFLGVTLPSSLAPKGDTYEWVDDQGRFNFHVEIGFPWTGLIVRYRGWLAPVTTAAD